MTMTIALMSGRLRSGFRLWTETTLTASDSESLRYPGINNVTLSCFGSDKTVRKGMSARPVDSSPMVRLTTSTAWSVGVDCSMADWVRDVITKKFRNHRQVLQGFTQLLGNNQSVVFSIVPAKTGLPIFVIDLVK